MPVTHDALVARLGLEIGISSQEVSDFRLSALVLASIKIMGI